MALLVDVYTQKELFIQKKTTLYYNMIGSTKYLTY